MRKIQDLFPTTIGFSQLESASFNYNLVRSNGPTMKINKSI